MARDLQHRLPCETRGRGGFARIVRTRALSAPFRGGGLRGHSTNCPGESIGQGKLCRSVVAASLAPRCCGLVIRWRRCTVNCQSYVNAATAPAIQSRYGREVWGDDSGHSSDARILLTLDVMVTGRLELRSHMYDYQCLRAGSSVSPRIIPQLGVQQGSAILCILPRHHPIESWTST